MRDSSIGNEDSSIESEDSSLEKTMIWGILGRPGEFELRGKTIGVVGLGAIGEGVPTPFNMSTQSNRSSRDYGPKTVYTLNGAGRAALQSIRLYCHRVGTG